MTTKLRRNRPFRYPLARTIYNQTSHPLSKIPGPRLWSVSRIPFIRALLRGTVFHDIQALHRKYGPVLRIAPDEVTFCDPSAYTDILTPRPNLPPFLKDPTWWAPFPPTQPVSIVTAVDPASHARIRKILPPGFSSRAVRQQEPFLHRYVDLLISRLREHSSSPKKGGGQEIDIGPWMNYTAFDIFGDLGFVESFGCLETSRYHPWIALLFGSVKAAAYGASARYFPGFEYLLVKCMPASLKKMQDDHFQQIVDKVQRRMNYELQRPDIMGYVIQEQDETKSLPRDEIDATFAVLVTTGSETTATDLLDKVTAEVRRVFSEESDITLDRLKRLEYLNAVLNEGLRLCTPVPWILPRRVPAGGASVSGVWLPGGTRVSVQAYAINKDEKYWLKPERFLPERWLPEAATNEKSPFYRDNRQALQAFIVGSRNCLGQNLAWAEMRLIVAKMLWNFDLDGPQEEGKKLRWEDLRTFLLVEKKPVWVRMRERMGVKG
ncbi:hypothetical protein QBC35DRAFT_545856 [Podospora australis]|uniref:Cytochrome P450 n=1 Tax=Podospora australis TaxID=1536484 RepID=A0AAN7AJG8_9PEZI|nr:hypothetical protein QBC35DRAFT_545856 [Podospora australis]